MKSLRQLREAAILSQNDLALKAGLSVNTICRLEKGKQKPNFKTTHKLARALGIKPEKMPR